jgi:hypothetical protein
MTTTTLQKGNRIAIIDEIDTNVFECRVEGTDETATFTQWTDARHWAWNEVNRED